MKTNEAIRKSEATVLDYLREHGAATEHELRGALEKRINEIRKDVPPFGLGDEYQAVMYALLNHSQLDVTEVAGIPIYHIRA